MANQPANAGSSRGQAPLSHTPLPPRTRAGHRATRPKGPKGPKDPQNPKGPRDPKELRPPKELRHHSKLRPPSQPSQSSQPGDSPGALAWIPYLIVLAGVGAGLLRASEGSKYAGWGAGLVGCSLLAAALARLVLPPRLSGLLSSRRKALDVLAFAVFGAGVLAVALILPP
jgi:hypothetical protein